MTVVVRLRGIGLAELQILILANFRARQSAVLGFQFGWYSHEFWIERANAFGRPARHLKLDIGDAERDATEARGIRLIAAQAIAPRTCPFDEVLVLAKCGRGGLRLLCDPL